MLNSLSEILWRIDVVKADGQQDSAELPHLRTNTKEQPREIQFILNKVTKFKEASTPATFNDIQDDLNALFRELDLLRASRPPPLGQESTPQVNELINHKIYFLGSKSSFSFKSSFKEISPPI